MTTVAGAVLEVLGEAGVRTVFGLPGVHNLAFWRDAGSGAPEIVLVRHEQTAVYAADGLARATGGLGAALTTTGPGAANAVAAFGEAAASHSPVVLVASEISTRLQRPGVVRGALHESLDQAALFDRWRRPSSAPDRRRRGAGRGPGGGGGDDQPRGPVYVDIPTDVLDEAAALAPTSPPRGARSPSRPTSTGRSPPSTRPARS